MKRAKGICIILVSTAFVLFGATLLVSERGSQAETNSLTEPQVTPEASQRATPPANLADTVLYSFCAAKNCTDGSAPYGALIRDSNGNLYGTTETGGNTDHGTVFKITPAGVETVLYSFCQQTSCADGNHPRAGLVLDPSGDLYGTTFQGGARGEGVVFRLGPLGAFNVLYSLCSDSGCKDGSGPQSSVIRDSAGNLFGTATSGGAHNGGTVFELTGAGVETVLHNFCSQSKCVDGESPEGSLVADSQGNLYGTTTNGGHGYGTVFKLNSAGVETVLWAFCPVSACADGAVPLAGLIRNSAGNLYGTTRSGGACNYGVVFEISAAGRESVLHSFCPASGDGSLPASTLVLDRAGNFFGTTFEGGSKNQGTAFRLGPTGNETGLHSFSQTTGDGRLPNAGLIRDDAGNLYGTGTSGGAHNQGAVYRIPAVTVRLTSSPNPSAAGESVTLTAAVSGISQAPTGSVTFFQGTTDLGTAPLVSGKANLTTSFAASGTYSIVASYSGDANYLLTKSGALKQVVQ